VFVLGFAQEQLDIRAVPSGSQTPVRMYFEAALLEGWLLWLVLLISRARKLMDIDTHLRTIKN
jgi:hypothetical protein